MMSATMDTDRRANHLHAFFRDVLSGKRQLKLPHDAKLFIEAVCVQKSAAICVEKIISKPAGMDALRSSVRLDLTDRFIESHTFKLIGFLADPSIKPLASGKFLQEVLLAVVEPPTLWSAAVRLFLSHGLGEDCLLSFAWLVHELVSMPSTVEVDFVEDIKAIVDDGTLMRASNHEVREFSYKIKRALEAKFSPSPSTVAYAAGGRHDNDFADFRKISIYPTTDEFLSTERPFYRKMDEVFEVDEASRAHIQLDNQFRLLREDMLGELRHDVLAVMEKKQARGVGRRVMTLGQLQPFEISHGDDDWPKPCTIALTCHKGLDFLLREKSSKAKKAFLRENPGILRHEAFGVLCKDKTIFGFAFIERNEDRLASSPPVVLLRFVDGVSFERALLALKSVQGVQFMLVDTPVFAYEPVLKGLQGIHSFPLPDQLLKLDTHVATSFEPITTVKRQLGRLQAWCRSDESLTLPETIPTNIQLDKSQTDSFVAALHNPVTIIQGPPGTGKSFIGALIVKELVRVGKRVLVVSYTNHALDEFLKDLSKAGIEWDSMVRLGGKSKCDPAMANVLLSAQRNKSRLSMASRSILDGQKLEASRLGQKLSAAFNQYYNFTPTWDVLSEQLEFSEHDRRFYDAFLVPSHESGWKQVGRNHREIGPDYLFKEWSQGRGPGVFRQRIYAHCRPVWEMPLSARKAKIQQWTEALLADQCRGLQHLCKEFDGIQDRRATIFSEGQASTLKSKQVIGSTTTSAAKHNDLIRGAEVDAVLVEEAGEIMETHVLTALSTSVKQLILIGDHKQLRPKVNNYRLTVEKGEGFNLNMSLFERLIVQGAPHTTLQKQHRMSPEISLFVRELTYPDLVDDEKTKTRPLVKGLRDRVIFFNHGKQEEADKELADRRDPGGKSSKKNEFEAEVVIKCVKYLSQLGYPSDRMVVLTPYLGQLRLLRDKLKQHAEVDPVLNDLDSSELVRAGLLTEAAAKVNRKPLRISTIDNYQGEESEIVLASLTRSNDSGDIGFMAAPERLNVLLSRARDCLVLIGNMETFMKSKKGQATWAKLFELLRREKHLYDGLPVKCEQHPATTALLKEPADFETFCPDGGCSEPS